MPMQSHEDSTRTINPLRLYSVRVHPQFWQIGLTILVSKVISKTCQNKQETLSEPEEAWSRAGWVEDSLAPYLPARSKEVLQVVLREEPPGCWICSLDYRPPEPRNWATCTWSSQGQSNWQNIHCLILQKACRAEQSNGSYQTSPHGYSGKTSTKVG